MSDWLRQHFTYAELAPEAMIASRVTELLKQDAKLAVIFGSEFIQLVDYVSPQDFDQLPKLLITTVSLSSEPAPASIIERVTVYVVLRWLEADTTRAEPWEPGLTTLARHVCRILGSTANRQLNTIMPAGTMVQLARRGNVSAQGFTFRRDPAPDGARQIMNLVIPWEYEVTLDVDTQRIRTVVSAGG